MPVQTETRLADGDHVVQFYEHEDDLAALVGSYLGAAAADGEAVVVIASPEHAEVFQAALCEAGVDLAAARAGGRLVVLDAAATLERLMVAGVPDAGAFDASVGAVVRAAGAGGRRVRAYGEMVALLWAAGDVTGALELEQLWNALAAESPFSLVCAYPAHLFGPTQADGFTDVCHIHSAVVGGAPSPDGAEVSRRFARTLQAPRLARRFVADVLRRWGHEELVEDGMVVAAELVSNAVMHASSDVVVGLSRRGEAVELVVGDSSTEAPTTREPEPATPGGRGLRLVGALARRWGHVTVAGGKLVWAELGANSGVDAGEVA